MSAGTAVLLLEGLPPVIIMQVKREFNEQYPTPWGTASFFVFLSLLLPAFPANAQWTKIGQFPHLISSIYFLDKPGPPDIGFIGEGGARAENLSYLPASVWRTDDAGTSWNKANVNRFTSAVAQFCFLDASVGWFAAENSYVSDINGGCYATMDGGENWQWLSESAGSATSVRYNAKTNLLIIGKWGGFPLGMMYSADAGQNWEAFESIRFSTGVDFLDSLNGMVTCSLGPYWRTTDGGVSWMACLPFRTECWQPLAVRGTSTYFTANEGVPDIMRSTDAGLTWERLLLLPYKPAEISGMIAGDFRALIFQAKDGFQASYDSGYTWRSICGPPSSYDTRFYLRDDYLYAPDPTGGLWLNRHPLGRGVPVFYDSPMELAQNCEQQSSKFPFNYSDPCIGGATLDSVSIDASADYSFDVGIMPREVSDVDSFAVLHQPLAIGDTAHLTFHFTFQGERKDTTITIVAPASQPALQLAEGKRSISIPTDTTNFVSLRMGSSIPSSFGLTTLHCDLTLTGEAVSKAGTSVGVNGWEVTSEAVTGDDIMLELSRTSGGPIEAGEEIVRIPLQSYVALDTTASLVLQGFRFNSDFRGCPPQSFGPDTVTITVPSECGDATLRRSLSGLRPFEVEGINPNPATDRLNVTLRRHTNSQITYEIIGLDGTTLQSGANLQSEIGTKSLRTGAYYLRLEQDGYVVTKRFLIER